MNEAAAPAKQNYAIVILIVGFLSQFAANFAGTLSINMSSFSADLGFSLAEAAWIASVFGLCYAAFGVLWGNLADRLGLRKQLAIASIVVIIGFEGFAFLTVDLISCIFWWGLVGAGMCGWVTAVLPKLTSNWFAPKHRAKGYMVLTAGGTICGLLLGIMLPPIINAVGWRGSFSIIGGLVFVFFLIEVIFMRDEPADINQVPFGSPKDTPVARIAPTPLTSEERAQAKRENKKLIFAVLKLPITWKMGILNIFYLFCYMAILQMLTPSLVAAGLTLVAASFAFTMMNIGKGIGQLAFPILADKFGRKSILLIQLGGITVMALTLFLVVGTGAGSLGAILLAVVCLYGFFDSCTPTMGTILGECYPTHLRGTGPGVVTTIGLVGRFCGPLVAGALVVAFGSQYAFLMGGIAVAIAFIIGIFVLPKTGGKYGDPIAEAEKKAVPKSEPSATARV